MRLIDADAMFERNKRSIYDTTDLKEMLDNEPTAYDVDRVVEQLNDLPKGSTWNHNSDNINRKSAIEIVKEGYTE